MRLGDGSSVFVKGATDWETAEWLRNEHRLLDLVGGRLGPEIIAWLEDGERPVLVTKDLSDAYWPAATGETVWRTGDVKAVFAAVDELRSIDPGDLGPVRDWPSPAWPLLVEGSALVQGGFCSAGWLERNGAAIVTADESAVAEAGCLVHGDVRSDNLCLLPGGGVRLVDWSNAGTGGRWHDLALLLPTLRVEGGPRPTTMLREPVELIARLTGATVCRAVSRPSMPDWLREVFHRLVAIDLEWLADVLVLQG